MYRFLGNIMPFKHLVRLLLPLAGLLAELLIAGPAMAEVPDADGARQRFQQWMAENHVPGLVWGVVKDGQLVHVEALGVADPQTQRPVTADTAFRIASMSKAFTGRAILRLAAEGKIRLDAPASTYVPELSGWADDITVAELLHHTAGFVTDDPWGDRQQALPEAEFTAMLQKGVPFQRRPGVDYAYSNFGYATLGRVITNVSGRNFADEIGASVFAPLGMRATTYEVRDVPRAQLALPWRYEDARYLPEPTMAAGAFGAMGGLVTTANDYAKWVALLLHDDDPLSKSMREGGGFLHLRARPGTDGRECASQIAIYAAGLLAARDCVLGRVLYHSGGYPGYGSHMLLLPDAGVGLFAFANRTYAGPAAPLWDVAGTLRRAGFAADRPVPVSAALADGYAAAARIWAARSITGERAHLAMNFEMDASAQRWAATLQELQAATGRCDTTAPIAADGALSGQFRWVCEHGTLNGQLLLAPDKDVRIQALRLRHENEPRGAN